MNEFIIAVLISIAAGIFVWVGAQLFYQAAKKYHETYTQKTKVKLADLYLFIDPSKILIFNVIIMLLAFIFSGLILGNYYVAIIIAIVAAFLPQLLYKILTKRRQKLFLEQLPDLLLATSTSMKAGSSLNQSLEGVTAEASDPIAQEFELFLRELRVGVDFNAALDNLYHRMPLIDFKMIVSGMQISKSIGGNLADTLERLASTLRRKLEMEGKIDALTAQGRAQGIVMTLLPIVLGYGLYLMEPEQMSIFWTHWLGWALMAVIAIMLSLGYFVIQKIVNIDV